MTVIADPRIAGGMQKQLAARRKKLAAGEVSLGWKVGLSTPAAQAAIGTKTPMLGYLLRSGIVPSGGAVRFKGWVKPVAEAEIAVHIGRDLEADADDGAVRAAIAALGPAIELLDMALPPVHENLETILAEGLFQRHVVLGATDASRAGGNAAGLNVRLSRNGAEIAQTADPEANTGKVPDIVRHVATMLAACGERLRAGDVIIAGSITPPLFLSRSDRELVYELDPIDRISVNFSFV
jgi:2-keto-4-pentenoate hydratase